MSYFVPFRTFTLRIVDEDEVLRCLGGGGGALYLGCCSKLAFSEKFWFFSAVLLQNLCLKRSTVIVSASTVVASSCKTFLSAYTISISSSGSEGKILECMRKNSNENFNN